MDGLSQDGSGLWVLGLEAEQEKQRRLALQQEALLMEGLLCPRYHAENFTQIVSFLTSDRHCHVLNVQVTNLKVMEVK